MAPDIQLGRNVKIFAFVNLYGCKIGDNTKIGTFVEIQKGAQIGLHCKDFESLFHTRWSRQPARLLRRVNNK